MMSSEFQNRTLICSVLFIDIVEYSRQPVVEQGRLKDVFNRLLSEALRSVAVNDRIILDTGDGAAISFIGDPEDALFVATGLRDVIAANAEAGAPQFASRMGINLGPVRLVKDINGQPNIIGDGINVAQRVMTFAKPGQVLVSRSYYEVVSRLSDESSRLFSYEGSRTDKHIREHEVYAVGEVPRARQRSVEPDRPPVSAGGARFVGVSRAARGLAQRILRKPRVLTAAAVAAIIAVALAARAYRSPDEPVHSTSIATAAMPAAAVTPATTRAVEVLPPIRGLPPEPAVEPVAEVAAPPAPPAVEKKPRVREAAKPRQRVAQSEEVAPREIPRPVPEPPQSTAPAAVSLAIAPWGEVHVDGTMRGVSPPLQELELPAGRHRIEIRNGGSTPHVLTLNAKAGQRLRIKHKFE